ncbi:MAG: hypothetical protein ACERKN_19160 [Velocimicrobium sp.]
MAVQLYENTKKVECYEKGTYQCLDYYRNQYQAISFPVKKGKTYTLKFYNAGKNYESNTNIFFIKDKPVTTSKSAYAIENKWYVYSYSEYSYLRTDTWAWGYIKDSDAKIIRADSVKVHLDSKSKVSLYITSPLWTRFSSKSNKASTYIFRKSSLDNGSTVEYKKIVKDKNIGEGNIAKYSAILPEGDYYINVMNLGGSTDLAYKYTVDQIVPFSVNIPKHTSKYVTGTAPTDTTVYCKVYGKTYKAKTSQNGAFKIETLGFKKNKLIKIWYVSKLGNRSGIRKITIQ